MTALWQFREEYEDGDASSWPLNTHNLENNLLCRIDALMSNGRCSVIVDGTPKVIVSITITQESAGANDKNADLNKIS